MSKRDLRELVDESEPAWPAVLEWIAEGTNAIEVLPVDRRAADDALALVQVTTRSPMGAVIHQSGGILVDHGWVRILGSGSPRLPRSLPSWNRGRTWTDESRPPACLLIGDDAVGGLFAINGGALPGELGHVHYFAPDSLEWEDMELGYSEFLDWAFTGDLATFYEDTRWPGWDREVRDLAGDSAFSIFPFLWTEGPPIGERSRRPVPIAELYALQIGAVEEAAHDG